MLLVKRMLLLCTLKFKWPVGVTQSLLTRVAPLQVQTIPRLELLGALLLSRLLTSVTSALSSELALNPPICFTDSKVALFWIRGCDKEWRQFVKNRVREIQQFTCGCTVLGRRTLQTHHQGEQICLKLQMTLCG